MSVYEKPTGPAVSASTDFRDYLPREAFDRLAAHYLQDRDGQNYPPGWHDAYHRLRAETVGSALEGFLSALRDEGKLGPIPGGAGRQIDFQKAWNGMVTQDSAFMESGRRHWRTITGRFSHNLAFDALYPVQQELKKGVEAASLLDGAYEYLVATANAGRFGWWQLGGQSEWDPVTDERFELAVQAWHPTIGTPGKGQDLVPMTDIEPPTIREAEVTFETGDLLIADWFRIAEFTEAVRDPDEYAEGKASINSTAGRERSVLWNIDNFGFISVHVGNTSPRAYAVDGTLVFGHTAFDDEADDYLDVPESAREVGHVITDLWNATVIDRARLTAIVATQTGQDGAERLVADYLEKEDVSRVSVEPGTYHLYFCGNAGEFADRFSTADADIPPAIRPMFVLSNRPLELRPPVQAGDAPGAAPTP